MFGTKGYTLRFTISLLVFLSVLLTAFVGCYSAIKVNKESLSISYLENNYQYAKKLTVETSNILSSMQQDITGIAEMATDHVFNDEEINFYLNMNNRYFNSIFVVNNEGVIQSISPSTTGVSIGTKLDSEASKQAIKERKPLISDPYIATSGRLILLISSPVFDDKRNYKGFVGGTIYLEDTNYLNSMLSDHFYGNGSYVYVVDGKGRMIFHPDTGNINKSFIENKAIRDVLQGNSRSAIITNSQGEEYFVGYSYEPSSNWGIVSQTPTAVLKDPLRNLYRKMFLFALPLFVIIIFGSWWVAFWISKPLYLLAKYSEEVIRNNNSVPIPNLETSSKIMEVQQLYHQINNHLILLNTEIQLDGLTGLANRKTFNQCLENLMKNQLPFSLILLDIDYFKKVNDTCGHLVGDEVLKFLGSKLKTVSRINDLCFRYGGEEFGIVVKNADLECAVHIAERIRKEMETSVSPTGEPITVSLGIACYEIGHDIEAPQIINKADQALYRSKIQGRNRTTTYIKNN